MSQSQPLYHGVLQLTFVALKSSGNPTIIHASNSAKENTLLVLYKQYPFDDAKSAMDSEKEEASSVPRWLMKC